MRNFPCIPNFCTFNEGETVQQKINKTKLSRSVLKHPICSKNICDQNIIWSYLSPQIWIDECWFINGTLKYICPNWPSSINFKLDTKVVHPWNKLFGRWIIWNFAFYVLDTWQHKCLIWPWFFYWYCTLYMYWLFFFQKQVNFRCTRDDG